MTQEIQDEAPANRYPNRDAKAAQIASACEAPCDVESLRLLATADGGLLSDGVRRKAWPLLLGCDRDQGDAPSDAATVDWRKLPRHKDEDQVALDVHRSFIYYPRNETDKQLDRRKGELSAVITQVLRTDPMLCYFQGFHDIAQVFLLVLGQHDAPLAVSHLALLKIRDFMLPSLAPSLAHLQLLPAILSAADAELCTHLAQTQPYFALAATLTLYAHEIEEYGDIARLFDFLLAQEAVVSLYLFAQIILSRKRELLAIPADEPEMLHFTLSKLPQPLDLDALIDKAVASFATHPPEALPLRAWSRVSPLSVLKSSRGTNAAATLREGRNLFAAQASQLGQEELRKRARQWLWTYRRPAASVGLAIAVGIVALALRGSSAESVVLTGWRQSLGYLVRFWGGG